MARIPGASQVVERIDGDLDFFSVFMQLYARKWLLLFICLVGAGIGAFVGQLGPNQFEARSVVQIEQRAGGGVALPAELIGELLTGEADETSLNTEFHIIRSRLILDPVVEELDLDLWVEPVFAPVIGQMLYRRNVALIDQLLPAHYARKGDRVTVSSFTVDDSALSHLFTLEVLEDDQFRLIAPSGDAVEGRVGTPATLGSLAEIVVDEINAAPGRQFTVKKEPVRVAAQRIATDLSVSDRVKSEVVDFRYSSTDQAEAMQIVNAVVQSYRNQNLIRRSAEIDQSIDFIEQQMPSVEDSLSASVSELSAYQSQQPVEELSLGTEALLAQALELESSLNDLNFREEFLLRELAQDHPDILSLRSGKRQLELRLERVQGNLAELPESERELALLTQRVEQQRELFGQLQSRVEQLRILKASTVANIRVLEASEHARLVGPRRARPILISGIAAFVLGTMFVLLVNSLQSTVKSGRTLEELGLPLFSTVNKVSSLVGSGAGKKSYALAVEEPNNPTVEALRGLRTGLQFSLAAKQSKVLMITSCAPGDGKSFISLNLGLVAAAAGGSVLLMDVDLRRGVLARNFGMDRRAPGISDLLAGHADFSQIVTKDPATGLEFIPSGRYPPNPSELLSSEAFSSLVDSLSHHYDLIILDAPPALAVTDPAIIGQTAGISLLVVTHLKTKLSDIQSAQQIMSMAGVNLSGAILNKLDRRSGAYGYGSYGSYGYYSYGYGADDKQRG